MNSFLSRIDSLLSELDEAWEYDPYANEAGTTVYLGFASRMAFQTACGILGKNLEPEKWTIDDEDDGRIAIHVRSMSNQGGFIRTPPVNRLRHLMSAIGYAEGTEWWVEPA